MNKLLWSLSLGAALVGAAGGAAMAQSRDKTVVIANYGGAWAETLNRICIQPFTKETGITVTQAATEDSLAQIRAQQTTRNILWDIAPTERSGLPVSQKNGWLEPIDWSVVDPENKLPPIARKSHAIGSVAYSTTIGVRTDKLPEGKTFTGWKDFWDVKQFPGPRTLRNSPAENLEFALIADGVKPSEVYDVLRSPEGVDRAFKKLDEIKPAITVWWTSGQQPVQLLASGEVFYATAFNGRIQQLQKDKLPVALIWNGGSLDVSYYSIVKGANNAAAAMQFMKYCWNEPQRLAEIARAMPYSSFNPDLYKILSAEEARQLPTSPENMEVQFALNAEFWAENLPRIQKRWETWRLQ
ncbi:ABC transporter substrate-binding protein [Azospirillum sp. Vi22]|uniref:ABC transporter substrate-binding protein n=1 Tax=Azospirillum baldaniorum TaxID=1064539 RepID=UPI00157AD469|nr:ABC transporter substrate-binding protein [Azospirillum baldaniorum]NUB07666.1 ABC transporter substrate-binding protein [Azospirillum baldaniorum]